MKLFKDGKRAGASWKTLSEAERQAYKERSSAIRKELEAKFPNGLPKQKRRSIYDSGGIPRTGLNLYIQREVSHRNAQRIPVASFIFNLIKVSESQRHTFFESCQTQIL